ncbi:MAG: hypothetical protein IPN17_30035 [Deltaproteobacteria bacterium]|nr:hypothetical protein [Deltaproteobacteria bacterium]
MRGRTEGVTLELSRDVFERLLSACSPLALRFQECIAVAGIRQLRAATGGLARLLAQAEARRSVAPGLGAGGDASHIQTAATEWGVSLDDLDAVEVVALEGVEARGARRRR